MSAISKCVRRLGWLAAWAAFAAGCGPATEVPGEDVVGEDVAGGDAEETASRTDEIINGSIVGTNYYNVYVYVQIPGGQWGRCSGSIVATSNGTVYVATAYHCIEATPTPGNPQYVRVTTTKTPGKPTTPPSSWTTPIAIYFPSNAATGTSTDLAIIAVPDTTSFRSGLAPSNPATRLGLFFGNPDDHVGLDMKHYGYGCSTQTSTPDGTGTLRSAGPLWITSSSGPNYMNWDSTLNGGASRGSCEGDSGGPGVRIFSYPDAGGVQRRWSILLGTLSSGVLHVGFDVASPRLPQYVQTVTGRLYLSNFTNSTRFMHYASNSSGALVTGNSTDTGGLSMWYYFYNTRQLRTISGLCLRSPSSVNAILSVTTCSSTDANQQWTHTGNMQLKNVGSGRCAALSTTGNVVARTCSAVAEQAWAFRGDAL